MAGRTTVAPQVTSEPRVLAQLAAEGRVPFYRTWKGIVMPIIAVLALVTIDVTRRDSYEHYAVLVSASGPVSIQPAPENAASGLSKQGYLASGDLLSTGPSGIAVVLLADATTIVLEPNTQFSVRLIDFDRRDRRRDRSFMVWRGNVWCAVPKTSGGESTLDLCTPHTVATSHPGATFVLDYDPRTRFSRVRVVEGYVDFATPLKRTSLFQQTTSLARWYQLSDREMLTPQQLANSHYYSQLLVNHAPPPSLLLGLERSVAETVYVPLGWIGLGPRSWIEGSFDRGARARAQQAMKQLHHAVVDTLNDGAADFPEAVNPITLAELKLNDRDRYSILNSLARHRIELYQQYGRGYRLTAFAKDRKRTPFEVNHKGKVVPVDTHRARTLLLYQGATSDDL